MAQLRAKPVQPGSVSMTPQDYRAMAMRRPRHPQFASSVTDWVAENRQQLEAFMAGSVIGHNMCLDIRSEPANNRLTRIVCTIGPASREVDMLMKLMRAGMNICRLNFSHGTYEYHAQTVQNIRDAVSKMPPGTVVGIALDTKGPEIRTGLLEDGASGEVKLETGGTITLTTDDEFKEKCSAETLWVDYKNIGKVLQEGGVIYIDDGLISLKVVEKKENQLVCEILNGGLLGSKKGCNLPNTAIDLPAVSGKDTEDLLFGLEQKVDMVFASFIQDGKNIRQIREVLGEKGKHIKIISKIESYEGLYNFHEVLQETDGVMVARGDMGIEIPPEKVFIAQKMMIAMCNAAGKPIINATQMLESMTYKPRATRAESNDVANAVLDGADCVMLSGESAKGMYPIEAVTHMSECCREAESVFFSLNYLKEMRVLSPMFADPSQSLALAAVDASHVSEACAIICMSRDGRTGYLLSTYRPRCPILMITRNDVVARQSLLYRALVPILHTEPEKGTQEEEINSQLKFAVKVGWDKNILREDRPVVLIIKLGDKTNSSNCMQIVNVLKS